MKFIPVRCANPFDNSFLACFVHAFVIIVAIAGIYYFLAEDTFIPLFLGLIIISVIEFIWFYFHCRR
ncbi:MAG: hypothetical protein KDF59_03425 [Nitrosomonas sp.]|nr:hypothetical protein [Nitrosomonas sp.]